jgi:hypothetical protein
MSFTIKVVQTNKKKPFQPRDDGCYCFCVCACKTVHAIDNNNNKKKGRKKKEKDNKKKEGRKKERKRKRITSKGSVTGIQAPHNSRSHTTEDETRKKSQTHRDNRKKKRNCSPNVWRAVSFCSNKLSFLKRKLNSLSQKKKKREVEALI